MEKTLVANGHEDAVRSDRLLFYRVVLGEQDERGDDRRVDADLRKEGDGLRPVRSSTAEPNASSSVS